VVGFIYGQGSGRQIVNLMAALYQNVVLKMYIEISDEGEFD
jgi:hypothetical protein